MHKPFQNNDRKNALEAQYEAQKIAFAPIIFQVAKSLRDLGILKLLLQHHKEGLSPDAILEHINISPYGLRVLLESGISADIVKEEKGRYFATKTGFFLQNDTMTNVNMNYSHYVNYQALYSLEESIKEGKPEGLKHFGEWSTIYPALSTLPQKVSESWFAFDHFYSDSAFPEALQILQKEGVTNIMDIGGNTGKFALLAAKQHDFDITLVDIKEQVVLAQKNVTQEGLEHKISFVEGNMLDEQFTLPVDQNTIWMSQFLDCFGEKEILMILLKAKKALAKEGAIYIMEPLWDRQKFEAAAFCIINTSPYFTVMANGYSKMFGYEELKGYIEMAGLKIEKVFDNLGVCQNLLKCSVAE